MAMEQVEGLTHAGFGDVSRPLDHFTEINHPNMSTNGIRISIGKENSMDLDGS